MAQRIAIGAAYSIQEERKTNGFRNISDKFVIKTLDSASGSCQNLVSVRVFLSLRRVPIGLSWTICPLRWASWGLPPAEPESGLFHMITSIARAYFRTADQNLILILGSFSVGGLVERAPKCLKPCKICDSRRVSVLLSGRNLIKCMIRGVCSKPCKICDSQHASVPRRARNLVKSVIRGVFQCSEVLFETS